MKQFHSHRVRRGALGVAIAGVAISAAGFFSTVVDALPAGTPPAAGLVLSPSSGDSSTEFAMQFSPPNQACPGNNNSGFAYSTFITPVAQDPALLTFSPAGVPIATASGRTTAFRNTQDELVISQFPDLDTFAVLPPELLSFATSFSRIPNLDPGSYVVGIACFNANGRQNEKYWSTRITVTASAGAGPYNFSWTVDAGSAGSTTTTSTTTTTTTVAGGSTTTTVAGGSTTTTVAGSSANVTFTPASPTPGGAYTLTFRDCSIGETVTFAQPQSTPASVTAPCQASSTLASDGPVGYRRPLQAATGTATGSFTAAPTAAGSYTVTMTGTVSAKRTATFTVASATAPPGTGTGTGSAGATGGSPTGTTSGSAGTIPTTGSSTTSLIVWGLLLLVFGRMAILLGRKPKVLTGAR